MKVNWNRMLIGLLLALVFVTACSSPGSGLTQEPINTSQPNTTEAPGDTATAPVQSTPTEIPPTEQTSLCANTYYPVREGSTWTYASTGSPAGEYSFTDTITSVREDGFTLTSQFGDLTRTQEWACEEQGLVALQLGGTSAATLNTQDMQLNLEVKNVSGVTFPREITAGDEWQHNLEFEGQMDIAGQSGEATGSAGTSFTALGNESVTVPAGTFESMKIQVDSTLNINVGFQGLSVPVTISGTYTYWFVQDVGWVKASGTGDFGGQSFSETIELQSYNIP
jgi:hypothetical protein